MKLLRQTISQLILSESAAIVEDSIISQMVNEDLIFVVKMSPPYEGDIYLARRSDYDEEYGDLNHDRALGVITLTGTALEDTMAVGYSNIVSSMRQKGFGKLLYNVALMACSDENVWLAADRNEVSKKAQRLWQTWMNLPDLYDMEQMDHETVDGESFLTDTEEDDMMQNSFDDHQWEPDSGISERLPDEAWVSKSDQLQKNSWFFYSPEYKQQFLASGLTKRFQMKDTSSFSDKLEDSEILYY